jgi:hypothetical protein
VDYRYSRPTVCIDNIIVTLRRNVVFRWMCIRVCFSTSSVMFQSVRFHLVAVLLNVLQHNLACNKPNTWLWTWCKICTAWPVACRCSDRNRLNYWVEDKHKNGQTVQKSREVVTAEWRTLTSGLALHSTDICMCVFISSPIDRTRTHSLQHYHET